MSRKVKKDKSTIDTTVDPVNLPVEAYHEIDDPSMRNYLVDMFVPAIKDNYDITDIVRLSNGKWLIKMHMNFRSHMTKIRYSRGPAPAACS